MTRVGDRVKLIYTDDEYTLLSTGATGVVEYIDDLGTVHVRWDSGSLIGLIPDHDRWEVIGDG